MVDEIKPKTQFIGKPPAIATNSDRLPKYPAGDKKVLSQMKQAQREEIMKESLYTMDTEHEKALKEELDKFEELIKQQYENPEDETEKTISKFMNDSVVPHLRKILTLHVRKRILDVRTNLCVRVICQYKPPKRELLDAFLKNYGVISIRPTERNRNFQVAICDTYENFDALCRKESAEIDNLKVSFKPFNMTGPPLKGGFKKQLDMVANIKATEINNEKNNIAAKETETGNNNHKDEDEGQKLEVNDDKTNFDDQENPAYEECEISSLDKSEDVILINDDLNKSKDLIVIDEDIQEKTNEASSTDADSKVTGDNKGSPINKELVTVNSNKATIPDNSEITEQDVPELIDNADIADDDLEDF